MRKTISVATAAAIAGFCFASASSYAALRYNIWKASDANFRLGYVIGYIDAATLASRKDIRLQVPTRTGKNYDRWVNGVNAFYADPANASREVPDAIYEVGTKIRNEMLSEWGLRRQARPLPSPSVAP